MFANKGTFIFSFWGSVPRRVGWLWIGIRFHQKLWAVSLGKAATLSLFPPQEYLLSSCSEDEIMMFVSSSLIMFISAWCLVYIWSTGGFQGGVFCACGHGWGTCLHFGIQSDAIWIQMETATERRHPSPPKTCGFSLENIYPEFQRVFQSVIDLSWDISISTGNRLLLIEVALLVFLVAGRNVYCYTCVHHRVPTRRQLHGICGEANSFQYNISYVLINEILKHSLHYTYICKHIQTHTHMCMIFWFQTLKYKWTEYYPVF